MTGTGGQEGGRPETAAGPPTETVLIVDDEPLVRSTLGAHLRHRHYAVETVEDVRSARERMKEPRPDLILLDLQLPDGSGIDLLEDLCAQWPESPVIMMTGHATVESAVRAIQIGAVNYVQKPFDFEQLSIAIRQAIDTNRLKQRHLDELRRAEEQFSLDRLEARSDSMKRVIEQSRIVADSRATTVLLLGESGTGKGMIASAIHYASERASQPFLKVTCSAIPEQLLEAEMFGHEKGAFTDAKERRRGVFESADRGAVFLDEIGDMPLSLQAKLLGVIEDRSFSRIGGTQRVEVDVRIIAATHRDLEVAVEEGQFREDLLYRLRVVPIIIPALRDRPDDIIPLAERFLEMFQREFGTGPKRLSKASREYLRSHSWPGNVRELRNVLERAMLFSSGEDLEPADLLIDLGYRPRSGGRGGNAGNFTLPADGVHLETVEQDLVRQAMQRSGNNQSRAAALLGISRDQIRYRLEKMGLLGGGKKKP